MNNIEVYAIKVEQPLCDFFITSLSAKILKKIAFSEQLQYHDENGKLKGSQRKIDDKRLKEIGRYIDSVELSFPNSIILAVNYNEDGEIIEKEELRWEYVQVESNLFKIKIPTDSKLAAVIDGQHRLKGFDYITDLDRLNTEMPCSIFFDLPNSYQAYLFATINGNQKKVDKSLALEQFGFNVEEEPQKSWTPEKLAVYFVRQLNFKDSPLKGHIRIAPKISSQLQKQIFTEQSDWIVSTATIVDGILNLYSSNPKRDRVEMAQENIFGKRTRGMVKGFTDKTPLRKLFLEEQDETIFQIIKSFLQAAKNTIWKNYESTSYIFKTVGVQAAFDLLKRILEKNVVNDQEGFESYLLKASEYNFSDSSIQASGIGRKDIRNALLLAGGLITSQNLKENDYIKIQELRK